MVRAEPLGLPVQPVLLEQQDPREQPGRAERPGLLEQPERLGRWDQSVLLELLAQLDLPELTVPTEQLAQLVGFGLSACVLQVQERRNSGVNKNVVASRHPAQHEAERLRKSECITEPDIGGACQHLAQQLAPAHGISISSSCCIDPPASTPRA